MLDVTLSSRKPVLFLSDDDSHMIISTKEKNEEEAEASAGSGDFTEVLREVKLAPEVSNAWFHRCIDFLDLEPQPESKGSA